MWNVPSWPIFRGVALHATIYDLQGTACLYTQLLNVLNKYFHIQYLEKTGARKQLAA